MCDTCGCSNPDEKFVLTKPGEEHKHHHHPDHDHHQHDHGHAHHHGDGHEHSHSHSHSHSKTIEIQQDVLGKNNLLAERNRGYFEAKNIKAYNLVSSPGSGKTSLLEKTIEALKGELSFYVIEGDQQSSNDANRIHATGAPAIQINTGNGCHLDSEMVNSAMKELDIAPDSILMIENVGNLVCPSLFDLGESKRIVIISTTEGEDKPLKYPYMFESSHLCIINKMDLVPYLDIDVEKIKQYAMQVNHHLEFLEISVKTGEGMDKWFEWLKNK